MVELRYARKLPPISARPLVCGSESAVSLLRPLYKPHMNVFEAFRVLLLDRGNRLKGIYTVSTGGLAGTVVDPRLIFSVALLSVSCSIVLSHNHPSGLAQPSPEDVLLTRKLIDGGKLLDVLVQDHLILCQDGYYSFAEGKML